MIVRFARIQLPNASFTLKLKSRLTSSAKGSSTLLRSAVMLPPYLSITSQAAIEAGNSRMARSRLSGRTVLCSSNTTRQKCVGSYAVGISVLLNCHHAPIISFW